MIEWWGPILHEYYAGTENNGYVYCDSAEWLDHKGTVGTRWWASPHRGRRWRGATGGQTGTSTSTAPTFSYHNDPDKTAEHRTEPAWRTLGDVGYVDEDGFLYLTDRKVHDHHRRGERVPQEAENVLVNAPQGGRRGRAGRAQR